MIVLAEWTDANNKSPKLDKFILAGVHYVMQTAPNDARRIKPLKPGILDELDPGENLYILGHGASQKAIDLVKMEVKEVGTDISGQKPEDLAKALSGAPPKPVAGPKRGVAPANIILMSCHAGQEAGSANPSYLAQTVNELAKTKTKAPHGGLMTAWKGAVIPEFREVKQAGPTIKEKKEFFEHVAKHQHGPMELRIRVIKDDSLDKAADIQNQLLDKMKNEDPLAQSLFDEVENGPGPVDMRAAHSARNLQKFYRDFVEECDKQGCLYKPDDAGVQVSLSYTTQGV